MYRKVGNVYAVLFGVE